MGSGEGHLFAQESLLVSSKGLYGVPGTQAWLGGYVQEGALFSSGLKSAPLMLGSLGHL